LFERPGGGERAILVNVALKGQFQDDLSELEELVLSAAAVPVASMVCARSSPDSRTFIGAGKVEELDAWIRAEHADLVVFNHALSPSQERNLERALETRVIDRTGLILDIFAQRAQSFEGKLQVELAQLRHLSTRLVRGWTHLERQKGGIGLRGPGETQLETDRRLLGKRIKAIRLRLEKVDKQRAQGRNGRKKAELPTVSLVGYTNAGKSTLFNALTDAGVYTQDQLFATLDPTLRKIQLTPLHHAILADTVGFIRHLPHELVAAFRSTLQETVAADLLIHVVDAVAENRQQNIQQVNLVLDEIDAGEIRQLEVFNKIDLMPDFEPKLERDELGLPVRVWLSAAQSKGLKLLNDAIVELSCNNSIRKTVELDFSQAALRSRLFNLSHVIRDDEVPEVGWRMEVEIHKKDLGVFSSLM